MTRIHTRDASMMDHDQSDVTLYSQGLNPDTRVRLAHFSVKEYLESERISKSSAKQFYLESTVLHHKSREDLELPRS